jgi:hypothetical protein
MSLNYHSTAVFLLLDNMSWWYMCYVGEVDHRHLYPIKTPIFGPHVRFNVSNLSLCYECFHKLLVMCRYQHSTQICLSSMPVPSFFFIMRTHVADLYVTCSGTAHLTFTCEVRSPNCPAYFGQPENDGGCMLFGRRLVYVRSWFRYHNPVVLWHTTNRRVFGEQRGYAAEITNDDDVYVLQWRLLRRT